MSQLRTRVRFHEQVYNVNWSLKQPADVRFKEEVQEGWGPFSEQIMLFLRMDARFCDILFRELRAVFPKSTFLEKTKF